MARCDNQPVAWSFDLAAKRERESYIYACYGQAFISGIYMNRKDPFSHSSFGRILADSASKLINLYSVNVTSLAAFVEFYCLRNFDTVGVWGSNPHAPTNFLNNLPTIALLSVTPIYAIQS
jgi:hypothetical protein